MFRFINIILVVFCINIISCQEDKEVGSSSYMYYKPFYDRVKLVTSTDTLHLPLVKTNNDVKSVNSFSDHGVEYVAIYNEPSEMISVYELYSQKLIKSISLAAFLLYRKHGTSVYFKNFDSIFINNNKTSLFIADSSGINKNTINFSEGSRSMSADFWDYRPPVLKDGFFYESFSATDLMSSISKRVDWRLMCRLDLKKNKKERLYRLPERYLNKYYSYYFLNYSYCFNNRGNFVFSFAADSVLYETDFADVNRMFFARSQFQQGDIESGDKNKNSDATFYEFVASDSYGSVFFDPFYKRYLRIFKHKVNNINYSGKNFKEKSVIIFNEDLQIIGESSLSKEFLTNTLFFTSDGRMYARTRPKDKTALHFIRLMYKEKSIDSTSLVQMK